MHNLTLILQLLALVSLLGAAFGVLPWRVSWGWLGLALWLLSLMLGGVALHEAH